MEADLKFQKRIQHNIFFCLWAITVIFHFARHRDFADTLYNFLLTVAAIFLLKKPSSILILLIFLLLQLYESFTKMPGISNHWIFVTFVNLTILQALFYQVIKNKRFRIDKQELFETFAPIVRLELIILYFYVVFHKLNSAFFEPEVSCATQFLITLPDFLVPRSEALFALNAYVAIFIETLIPVLLCFRRTRNWGLMIGLIFHCIIAYPFSGYYDFSATIFALYFLFASTYSSNHTYKLWQKLNSLNVFAKIKSQKFSYKNLFILGLGFFAGLVLLFLISNHVRDFFRYLFWTAYSILFLYIFINSLKRNGNDLTIPGRLFTVRHWSMLIIPLVVFLNGLSPYLGLKTENSFAMFSNLRTENGMSNHYILPASMQIADYQKDMVEIVRSSDPKLQKIADNNQLIVFFRFKNIISDRKPLMVEYIRNGERKIFRRENASKDDELLQKTPYILQKLFSFRLISKLEPQPCAH